MEYKIQDIEKIFNGEIIKNLGNFEYTIKINDTEYDLRILSLDVRGIEFLLNQQYHKVKYLDNSTNEITMSVDGVNVVVNMHPNMDKIVYKNSGNAEWAIFYSNCIKESNSREGCFDWS